MVILLGKILITVVCVVLGYWVFTTFPTFLAGGASELQGAAVPTVLVGIISWMIGKAKMFFFSFFKIKRDLSVLIIYIQLFPTVDCSCFNSCCSTYILLLLSFFDIAYHFKTQKQYITNYFFQKQLYLLYISLFFYLLFFFFG